MFPTISVVPGRSKCEGIASGMGDIVGRLRSIVEKARRRTSGEEGGFKGRLESTQWTLSRYGGAELIENIFMSQNWPTLMPVNGGID